MAAQAASPAETRRRAIRKRHMSAGAIYDAPPAARQQKPAGEAGGLRDWEPCLSSEPDAHRPYQFVSVAFEVLRGHAVTPAIFDAHVDKRHRAPDQICMRYRQQFVAAGARSQKVGVQGIPDAACL